MLQLATGESAVFTNPTEFSRLFEDYNGLIFRTAYRITGSSADAEDVLQTIFLRLMRRDSGAELASEESYFRRAAVNASLDILRGRKSDWQAHLDPALLSDSSDVERSEIRQCLRRAFANLSPRAAEIFVLRHMEGLSNPEIARLLGMSQVLVAVTLHRARRQLQKEIRSYSGGKS